jgi:hypothetical protein
MAAVSVVASLPAQAETPGGSAAPATTPAPIPTLHCDFKTVNACEPDGTCKAGKDVAGLLLPLKVTIDFENNVVAAVDETGYARTDKFDAAADSADQLIIHGIDGAFGWQLVIHNSSAAASISFSTSDAILSGFGTCTNK